jgi:hypothetical protein
MYKSSYFDRMRVLRAPVLLPHGVTPQGSLNSVFALFSLRTRATRRFVNQVSVYER